MRAAARFSECASRISRGNSNAAMAHCLTMPKLGLTMTEGVLSQWLVRPKQSFRRGDPLFVVETDKVANEIEAAEDGVLEEVLVAEGDTVPVGAVLARCSSAVAWSALAAPSARVDNVIATEHAAPGRDFPAGSSVRPARQGRVIATPLARRLAKENNVDIALLTGSGPAGRLKAADVRTALDRRIRANSAGRRPASNYEKIVAKRLAAVKREIPHFYVADEAELSAALALRADLNRGTELHVTVTHLLLAALTSALRQMPEMNRVWREEEIEQYSEIDIGLAVQTERGLMAPVLRGLGAARLREISGKATDLAARARGGVLSVKEMRGGAITLSNIGMHGATYLTPVINPEQSAVLGVGAVREVFRPDTAGAPTLRRELGLVLACDHRVHDGVKAIRFLRCVSAALAQPHALL